MKNIILSFFLCAPVLTTAQNQDSVAATVQVDSLIQISRALTTQKDFDQALEVSTAAEQLALEKLGRESVAYGSCCFNRGRVFHSRGDHPKAEKWYLEAKAIREKALGKEHPDYVASLNNLAILYLNMGQYEKAEPLFLEALSVREKVFGTEHPDYAQSLNNLAVLYKAVGNYEKAEPLLLEALAIREKAWGKEQPNYASNLNNLAALYMAMGQYEKAEPLHLEALAIREKALGKQHPDYAQSLNNLAALYKDMGNYEKVEPLLLEALAILEKTLGKEHPHYATCLSNLAGLCRDMGNYEKAEPLDLEALAIREKALGKQHPDYAYSLNNLANLYMAMGNYEKAEPLYLEVLAILEKTLGKEHPDYASSLNNLAALYEDMGNYEKVEPPYLEALAILEKALGKEHPFYGQSLYNLVNFYMAIGNYEKVEPLLLEALAILEKTLGKEYPDYIWSQYNLANLYRAMGNYEKAEPLLLELSATTRSLLEKAQGHLSERELNNYLDKFSINQNQVLSFAGFAGSKKVIPACYDNSLFYKGFLLHAAGQVRRLALYDSAATEKYNLLKSYHRRLAVEYAKPIAGRQGVKELEEKVNATEKELVRTVAGYAEAMRQVGWKEVQAALKRDEAAVEFVHFRAGFPKGTNSTVYAALLLRPGDAQPQFIPLFEEKQLDSLVQVRSVRRAEYVDNLYAANEGGDAPLGKPQKTLYELIWQPLEKSLPPAPSKRGGYKPVIYFSPSGLLHRLNIGAILIPSPSGSGEETLADRHHLVELGSTRQLVIPSAVKVAGNDALLFGEVQYEMDSTAISQANAGIAGSELFSRGGPSFAHSDSTLRGGAWAYLKWTEKEMSALDALLKNSGFATHLRKGYSATEESFKAAFGGSGKPSPRVLHIATHGFFFPDPKTAGERVSGEEEPVFKLSDHPMIRSGLILAGANHAWRTGRPLRPGMDDGILTAYEISQLNLSNTELVVLSACETGLGDIRGNEGVYGLQRAFKIAGAKYLIMSLWQVPDYQTQELITAFYQKWLSDKMPVRQALQAAQKEMRDKGYEPYYWAGFVVVE